MHNLTHRLAAICFAAVTGCGPAHTLVGHTMRLLIILLLAGSASAEWVPSGPMTYYDATIDRIKIVGGGPLRNYYRDGQWREVNPDFYLQSGWLVSDSGQHTVGANLTTNVVWIEWNNHYLGLEVGPLYAYRRSTGEHTKLADPSFASRSYAGAAISIPNVYPGVDLTISNSPDDIRHRFQFTQSARNQIETWWQNNGWHDDIWIVNTIRLHTDSLNCAITDKIGALNLSQPRLLNLPVVLDGMFIPNQIVELEQPSNMQGTMEYRILLINGNAYLVEGFEWATVREWGDGTIGHYATLGNITAGGSAGGISNHVTRANRYTMSEAGTVTSISISARDNWNGDDTVTLAVYSDNSGPDVVLDSTQVVVTSSSQSWLSADVFLDAELSPSTNYWISYRVSSANTCGIYYTTSDCWEIHSTDADALDDPWSGGTVTETGACVSLYLTYTASGGGESSTRRRHILLKGN